MHKVRGALVAAFQHYSTPPCQLAKLRVDERGQEIVSLPLYTSPGLRACFSLRRIAMITLAFIAHFSITLIDGACLDHTVPYQEKCYVFLKPNHVKAFGVQKWGKDLADPNVQVVDTKEKAKYACEHLTQIRYETRLDLTESEKEELNSITKLQMGTNVNVRVKVVLVRPTDNGTFFWLQRTLFTYSNVRPMARAFLDVTSEEPTYLKTLTPSSLYQAGSTAVLLSDPGHEEQSGVMFLDPAKPYQSTAKPEDKVRHIICEYDMIADCQWISIHGDWCRVVGIDDCVILNFSYPKPGHQLGKPCGPHTNRTIPCPDYRKKECFKNCTWSEWAYRKSNCRSDCSGSEFWSRRVINDSWPRGQCSSEPMFQVRPCCSGGIMTGIGWGFAVVCGLMTLQLGLL